MIVIDTVQFKDYIFAHNPASVTIGDSANVAEYFCPGKGFLTRNLGKKARIIKCSGSFFGQTSAEALEQAAEFRRRTGDGEGGILFLPGLAPFPARLREFALDLSGDGRILPYTLVFVEREAM